MTEHIVDNFSLISQWDYYKNNEIGLDPSRITTGSGKKAWWICPNNHSWFARIDHRRNGAGCPYCAGHIPIDGINDLASKCKETLAFWDYEKNGSLKPNMFSPKSERKVWWKCAHGHEWESMIKSFYNNPNCPYCQGKKLLYGVNDLETRYPLIAAEWNYGKNGDSPRDYFKMSNKVVWWKCLKGHEWKAKISARTLQGANCPFCSQRKASEHYNLLLCNHKICDEWDYDKNGGLTPLDFTPHSNEYVWWKCQYGHSWKASINNRTNGTGCPECKKILQTSFPEQAIFFYFKRVFPDAINCEKSFGYELDIYVPSQRIALEYDGVAFHSSERKRNIDKKKNEFCLNKDIKLIRIMELGLTPFDNCVCFMRNSTTSLESLEEVIKLVLDYIGADESIVNLERDYNDIVSKYLISKEETSIAINYPNLVEEWDWEKNGTLTPNLFTKGSSQTIWWKCKFGHSWKALICSRCKGHGCPICGRKLTIEGKQKKVLCVETNKVFLSIKEAATTMGLNKVSIIRCCQGKQKATQGYHWKYVDDHES